MDDAIYFESLPEPDNSAEELVLQLLLDLRNYGRRYRHS